MSFSQLCRPKSRVLSVERKKEIATQLNNAGFNCKEGDRVSVPGVGLNLTKRECYELAVTMDPTLAEAFYNLGTVLKSGEQATLGALTLTEGECFRRAVEIDSTIAAAWFNLGVCLRLPTSSSASSSQSYSKCQNNKDPNSENELAETQTSFFVREDEFTGEEIPFVIVKEKEYMKRDCYIQALEIDKKMAFAWFNLGIAIGANDIALIKGEPWNPHQTNENQEKQQKQQQQQQQDLTEETSYIDMDCFVCALNLDARMPAAWEMAGRRLSNIESSDEAFCGKNIKLSNTSGDEQNSSCDDASCSSSADSQQKSCTKNNNKPTIQVGDKFYNAHECFVESLKLDPLSSSVWFLAGMSLDSDQTVFDLFGKLYDKQTAFETSLEKFEHRSVVWYELGSTLLRKKRRREMKNNNNNNDRDASCVVLSYAYIKGKKYTPLNCFTRCLELDDFNAKAWFNLGVLMIPNTAVDIHGENCDEKICFEKCLSIDPTIGLAWFNLATTLIGENNNNNNNNNKMKKGLVGADEYSRGECFVLSLSQDPKHRASWFHLGRYLEEVEHEDEVKNKQEKEENHAGVSTGPRIELVNGECVTAKNCYEKCIELDNKDLAAWRRLAKSLTNHTKENYVNEGQSKCDDNQSGATIRGQNVSRDDCMKMIALLTSTTF